jgi:glycosyltransferase involved in cell wall biosynthesis
MLSILIPVYNFPCFGLAQELAAQADAAGVPYEIICMDDASAQWKEENRAIRSLPHAVYVELTENVGRSRIRNRLAEAAQYELLLFLDCDSRIARGDFIRTYLEAFSEADILAGGTLYEPQPPVDRAYRLHWTFGSRREPKPDGRQGKTFTANNFVIRKSVMAGCPFDERVMRYGHEDSLFQMGLERQGKRVCFIGNPVFHVGLETNRRFIEKTGEGVANLCRLYRAGVFEGLDVGRIRLLKTYLGVRKWGGDRWLRLLFPLVAWLNERTNGVGRPNLFVFDGYKLTLMSRFFRPNRSDFQENEEIYTEI